MVKDVLLEVLTAASLFFLNPLFVATLIAAVFLGYMRVKRERRSFRVRLMPGFTELKRLFLNHGLMQLFYRFLYQVLV